MIGAQTNGWSQHFLDFDVYSTGTVTWLSIAWVKYGKPSALGAVTGMVAGLGTITPASGFVGPGGALVIGISAGTVCFYATLTPRQRFKIDDSLDVFPVHGVGGILKLTNLLTPLRVTGEEETQGLDIHLHNERGYDL